MDSLTHIALGAVIGQAYAGKSVGRKAMVIGAIAQSIPDIDIVGSFWLSPVDDLLAHRGITHSILFGVLVSIVLGLIMARWGKTSLSAKLWIGFFALQVAAHLLLDSLNNYGTGWFEPFSNVRIAFDVIYVADPFYTIWPLIACIALLFLKNNHPRQKYWIRWSLVISTLYLIYAANHKLQIDRVLLSSSSLKDKTITRLFTTPAPLNNWLWFFAAETDSGFYTGYRSVYEVGDPDFHFHSRNENLSDKTQHPDDLRKLKWFSRGLYTLEQKNDTLVFSDLRFGQVVGWADPNAPFAFHYYLDYPKANGLVVQRGRFARWDRTTMRRFVDRILGEE